MLLLTIENKLGKLIQEIGEKNTREALKEEELAALIEEGQEEDFEKWKKVRK